MSPSSQTGANQATLTAFDSPPSDSSTGDDSGESSLPDDSPDSEPPVHEETLPDVCEWSDSLETIDGVTVAVPAADSYIDRPGGGAIRTENVAYVVDLDELEAYRARHAQTTVAPPKYYSRLDEFESVLTAQTAVSRDGGCGITTGRVHDALRLLAGEGRFRTDAVTLTACGRHRFIAEYHTEDTDVAYLIRPGNVHPTSSRPVTEDYTTTEHTVDGMTIPDDHPKIGAGVEQLVTHLREHYGTELVTHLTHDGRYHHFQAADGTEYRITGTGLLNLTAVTTPIGDLLGEHHIETAYGESFTAEWETIHYTCGDSPWPNRDSPSVIGALFRYEDPRTSSRASLSSRLKAYATYVYTAISEPSTEDDVATVDVKFKDERIARFSPTKEQPSISP